MVGMMGILKSGAAYVPLDPLFPEERLSMIIEETKAKALLTQRHFGSRLPTSMINTIYLDADEKSFGCGSFTTTFVNSLRQFVLFHIRQIYLLDYFQMIVFDSRKRSTSRWYDATDVEGLMVPLVLASLMEDPVLVEVATGSKGA